MNKSSWVGSLLSEHGWCWIRRELEIERKKERSSFCQVNHSRLSVYSLLSMPVSDCNFPTCFYEIQCDAMAINTWNNLQRAARMRKKISEITCSSSGTSIEL